MTESSRTSPTPWSPRARAFWPPTKAPARSRSASTRSSSTSTEDSRRDYREMLFRSTEAMKNYISGVILYDETIRQKAKDGTPLVDVIKAAGSIPGIKVDTGAKPLAGPTSKIETVTEGLDGLRERLAEYYELGARFAKWRAVITIADGLPDLELHQGQRPCARPLRRAVPGGRHRADRRARSADGRRALAPTTSTRCYDVTEWTLRTVFQRALRRPRQARGHGAEAEHGHRRPEGAKQASRRRRSPRRPCSCLKATVPAAVPGIAFLSGGQSDEAGDRASVADERHGQPAVGADVLLRPRAAGRRAARPGAASRRTSPPASAPSRIAPA